jgi:ribonuclease P protein component
MLPRYYSLKKNGAFRAVYQNSIMANSKYLIVYFSPVEPICEHTQRDYKQRLMGFSIRKKLGKATVRNKLKRQLKAIISSQLKTHPVFQSNFRCVFVSKAGAQNLDFATLKTELLFLLDKLQRKIDSPKHV